jgi:hypothetical protein
MQDLNFKEDGLSIINNFIDKVSITKLKEECEILFSKNQLNGPGYSVRLSQYVHEIPYPTSIIKSINLLEVAIDISKEIEKLEYKDYKLAHIALYNEINNPNELVWHSDLRNGGLIRAQICIEGGQINSGAFRYAKGSQKLKIEDSYPSKDFLEKNKHNIIICDKPNGSLFLINTIGYHSKCVCPEKRISFMFDFLPKDYIISNPNDVSADIYLTSSRLTDKVTENIELFRSGVLPETNSSNTPDNYKFNKLFFHKNI